MLTVIGVIKKLEDLKELLSDIIDGSEDSMHVKPDHLENLKLLRKNWDQVVELSGDVGFSVVDKEAAGVFFKLKQDEEI